MSYLFNSIVARKKRIEAGAKIRRFMDLSIARDSVVKEARADDRYKRTHPVLITPWRGDETTNLDSHIGITLDMSDNGVQVFFLREPQEGDFILSFVLRRERDALECFHFLAEVRNSNRFAPDIYTVGLLLKEHLEEAQVAEGVLSLTELIGKQYDCL
jgi:hypothetical protein